MEELVDMSYIKQMQNDLAEERSRRIMSDQNNVMNQATTMFNSEQNENLVKWQLDIKEELMRIEHLLRKHIPRRDAEGNEYFEEPSKENKLFNEKGVQEILNILAWYLNKNIILSDFDEKEINIRMHQFAIEFNDFLFNNYHEFGLADENMEKVKHIPMIVMNVVNTVEASYHRALGGKERDSLRTARTVTQNEPLGQQMQYPSMNNNMQNKFKLLHPTTWFPK